MNRKLMNVVPRPRAARRLHEERVTGKSWYRIENADGGDGDGPAAVYLYDEIGMWGIWASDFVRDLTGVRASQIDLHVNSPGGDVFDGIAIMAALAAHPATVTAHVDSLAASIASVIVMGADSVVMGRHATMMIHDASGISIGNEAETREFADLLGRISENIASVYAEKAGGQKRTWRNRMKAETWYDAAEAVTAGLADRVADAALPPGRKPDSAPDEEPPETEDPPEEERDQPEDIDRRLVLAQHRFSGRLAAPAPETTVAAAADSTDIPTFDPEQFRSAIRKAHT